MMKKQIYNCGKPICVTAGATYLDIDAYACMVAMAELMWLKGENVIAYSVSPYNYSVCKSLIEEGQIMRYLPKNFDERNMKYIIVDVSDPEFLKNSVKLDEVVEIYDHHIGFEEYWSTRIDSGSHIEFIGAAATLIYREWKKAGLTEKMKRSTALLLIAAILDNTLNFTSANTTLEDKEAFNQLCKKENIDETWCSRYFSEVQRNIEADLKNAIFNDIKIVYDNPVLPHKVAQLCIWDAEEILSKIPEIKAFFVDVSDSWMINIIDIKKSCGYFICEDFECQKKIEKVFGVCFEGGKAKTPAPYLRKEIMKRTQEKNREDKI